MSKSPTILLFFLLALSVSCWELDVVPCQTANCTQCDSTSTTCIECDPGFYLNDQASDCSECIVAIDNCASCTMNSSFTVTCDTCLEGYYIYNQGQLCRSCFLQIPDCLKCTLDTADDLTCDLCESGEFLTADAKECKSCFGLIPNCVTCQQAAKFKQVTCSACQQDYDLSQDKLSCVEGGSSTTWIIIVSVVGGILLIGLGFMIYRCVERKRQQKHSQLLDEDGY